MSGTHEAYRIFLEVAERGTFTEAAKRLHITQSAVSQQVKNLERDLGTTLVDRSNRRDVRLTAAGQVVFESARRMVQLEAEMRRRIADMTKVVRGTLTIGASYTIGEYILPMILTEFWDLYPEIEHQVEIYNTPAVTQAVAERRIDLGLVESVVGHKSGARVEELARDELVLIVPVRHRLASRREVSPDELVGETWIAREKGSGTREFTDHVLQTYDITPNRVVAFSSAQSVKEAVRSGLGIAFISSFALQTELAFRTVHMLRLNGADLSRPLSLIAPPPSVASNASNLFADFLRERFKTLSLGGTSESRGAGEPAKQATDDWTWIV